MLRVAIDTTPLRLGGGGVATYTRELLSAYAESDGVDVLPIEHDRTGASSPLGRIAAGIESHATRTLLGRWRGRRRSERGLLVHRSVLRIAHEVRGRP